MLIYIPYIKLQEMSERCDVSTFAIVVRRGKDSYNAPYVYEDHQEGPNDEGTAGRFCRDVLKRDLRDIAVDFEVYAMAESGTSSILTSFLC